MKILIFTIFLLFGTTCQAQTKPVQKEHKKSQKIIVCENPNQIPIYPGGIIAFRKEVSNEMRIQDVNEMGQINTEVSFIIDQAGNISKVTSSGNSSLDKELVRVVRKLKTRWEPAMKDGKAVAYQFKLPITMRFF